ncbi:MAG: AAA domain-containing protein [Ignavibacteriota bacterium]
MSLLPQSESIKFYEELTEVYKKDAGLLSKVISFKRIFRNVFNEISVDEDISFSNLYTRIDYIINTNSFETLLKDKIYWFKTFLYKSIRKKISFSDTEFLESLYVLSHIVSELSGTGIPKDLSAIIEYYVPVINREEDRDTSHDIDFIKCVILNITEIKLNDNGSKLFSIYCESLEESYRFSFRMFDSHFPDLEILNKNLKKYQTINLLNIKASVIEKYFYTSSKESMLVIEPDFLVEASEIAECFSFLGGNPNIFFVKKLIPSTMGESAFKGTLVNGLMDRLICNPNIDPKVTLDELIKESPLRAAVIGDEGINNIKSDIIRTHFINLIKLFKDKRNNKIKIEPTFLSPVYGINGRLDALIAPVNAPDNMNIFELKSGKAPKDKSVWQNHKMQIVCYNLLLKSAFGSNRKGTSSILYSSTNQYSFRSVSSAIFEEKAVLSVRNQIVSEIFNLSVNYYSILNKFLNSEVGTVPPFSMNDVIEFSTLLNSVTELESKYYRYHLSFAIREQMESKIGNNNSVEYGNKGFSSLWLEEKEEKEKDFNIITDISLSDFDADNNLITLNLVKNINHNFREGDFAILYKNDTPGPVNAELYRGKVKSISNDIIQFELHNRQLDEDYFSVNTMWSIEHDIVESNIWSVIQSMYDFLRASSHKRELILGLRKPQSNKKDYIPDNNLSEDQKDCIKKALEAEDYFLMQGPPGTGKTSTALIQIVKNIISEDNADSNSVVILAYTNRAVEEICTKLNENKINFLKIGGKAFNSSFDISEVFKKSGINELRENIAGKKVFVSTVTSFLSKIYDLKDIVDLHTVIIDEASQLYDSSIIGILCNFRKFILIGDQNQLPAVVTQEESKTIVKDSDLNKIGISYLNISLFERLYSVCKKNKWNDAIGMLETHYRLHEDISELINHAYKNKLKPGNDSQKSTFNVFNINSDNRIEKLLSSSRTIFIDSLYERTSKTNYSESQIVVSLMKTIREVYGVSFSESTLGIITPWRAQIALINKQIEYEDKSDKVTIDTVERFQGSERKIIIVSFAIHNPAQLRNLESINTDEIDRKLLVTLSRASDQLILVGYNKALGVSINYSRIIKYIKANGKFVNAKERKSCFGV